MLSRIMVAFTLPLMRTERVHSMAVPSQARGLGLHRNSQRVHVSETLGYATTFGLVSTDDDREHAFDQLSLEASRFACKIGIGRHESLSDLKQVEGGNDMGPSPKEIFYSALGSCTIMTIRTFFENTKARKGSSWAESDLMNIAVMLDEVKGAHAHIPEGINIFIKFEGNLSPLQKERLVQAANNCPVKQMMSAGIVINIVAL